jgi:hypothetical protein
MTFKAFSEVIADIDAIPTYYMGISSLGTRDKSKVSCSSHNETPARI